MSSTRRRFLQSTAVTAASLSALPRTSAPLQTLDGFEIARRHIIVRDLPTPDFFEGMLLGNGDIGVCVTARPDALGLHIGKSDAWDIRVSAEHMSHVLPFKQLLELWERASNEAKHQNKPDMLYLEREIPFFRDYTEKVAASYSKTWPRPWPCGIVWIHWDASTTQVVRQTLDPSCGRYMLDLAQNGRPVRLQAFVNTTAGHVCVWSTSPFASTSIAYYPNLDASARLPPPEVHGAAHAGIATFSAYQLFPATAPTEANPDPAPTPQDRNFALSAVVQGHWDVARDDDQPGVILRSTEAQPLRFDLTLFTPRDHPQNVAYSSAEAHRLSQLSTSDLLLHSDPFWRDHWSRSAIELEDKELERCWYHNQYWLACCLREGKIAPGLFGNWTSGKIGTAWHGDYHMNYNTQQVFWGVFSSNHADQHLPYIDIVDNLLPMSRKYARDKFDLPGAYFPHSAYPVPSDAVPYPAPPWGYEICETPWVVQSLWWHYLYTRDPAVLSRVYPLLKSAAQFVTAYVKLGDDAKFHVIPTVSPENWGCTVDFRLNRDCIMDLALIDFLLEAVVTASETLNADPDERKTWANIRAKLASFPRAAAFGGEVWLDVPGAPTGWIYNIPVTLAPVFPGERIGLHSGDDDLVIARHTAQTIRLEGGNDIVYLPLILARLAMLDLQWFKQQMRYCELPNGIVNDRVRQTGGRYQDSTNFDFMMRMGVWTENLSLPAVLNECMLQSYSGTIRLFPNTNNLGPARFQNLRAVGAFLVTATWDGRRVGPVELLSERGVTARIVNPWPGSRAHVVALGHAESVPLQIAGNVLEFATSVGNRYRIEP